MFKTADWPRDPHVRSWSTKTLLVMKLTFFLIFGLFFSASAELNAQKITLTANNLSYSTVFSEVKKQTGYLVAGRADLLAELGLISFSVKEMELQHFIELIFMNKPVSFRFDKKTIVLSRKQAEQPKVQALPVLFADRAPVSGMVYGEDGSPLGGVSIVVKKTKKGTISDAKGVFSLQAEPGDILSVSFVGYISQEVPASSTVMIVRLKLAHSVLDEAQITAYGKTSRRLATGNIGTIKAEDIEKQPVMTAFEAIAGRVPGIMISTVSGNAASPVTVSIRGRNSINPYAISDPLYVVDGIPLSTQNSSELTGMLPISMGAVQGGTVNTLGENPLLSINPKDIESISILKDADATAIYGSRGANGVILITTKRAKAGPATFSVNILNGIKMLERFPRLMNTPEYLAVRREAFQNDGKRPTVYDLDLVSWDPEKYTDWQRALVGTGLATDVNASVSGGSAQSKYRLAANYSNQKEIMNNGAKNIRGTFSSDFIHSSINQKFNFSINNSIAFTEVNAYAAINPGDLPPNAPDIYNSKGEFNFEPYRANNASIFKFNALKRPSVSNTFSYRGNMLLSYEIIKGLTISTKAGYHFNTNENNMFMPLASIDPIQVFGVSSATYGKSTSKNWMVEPQAAFNTYIGKGRLSVQLISNLQTEAARSESITAADFPNDAMMKSHNNGNPDYTQFREGAKDYKYLSVSGIVRYEWDRKYVINLNARRDGSSRFGPGKQFGNFGSVGLAWIASDEKWMKNILPSWFSFLNLKGSLGVTGSDPAANYEYLSRWSKASGYNNMFKYQDIQGFHVIVPLKQQFQWESTRMMDLSLTFGFLNDRMTANIAWYEKLSGNQLTDMPIPGTTGFKTALTNWPAEISNSGIEFDLTARLIQTKDWNLNIGFNVSRNWNKLVDFPGLETSSYKGQLKVGYSSSTQFLLHYTGIDPLTGSYTFEDRNKDGKVTALYDRFPSSDLDDRYVSIETMPKYSGGFSFQFSYKSLSVSSLFFFVNKLRQDPFINSVPGMMRNMPLPDEIKNNHWKQPGDLAKYPRYTTDAGSLGPITSSDGMWSDGSYVRWQNLSVSWQLPQTWINKINMKNASIAINTQNLLTFSAYKGLDPDMTVGGFTTPRSRTIATSLSFTF